MKTLIYFTNLVSICMNIWINTLFYCVLYMLVFSLCFLISDLDFFSYSLYNIFVCPCWAQNWSNKVLYLVSCKAGYSEEHRTETTLIRTDAFQSAGFVWTLGEVIKCNGLSAVRMKIWKIKEFLPECSAGLITSVFCLGYVSYYFIFVAKVRYQNHA